MRTPPPPPPPQKKKFQKYSEYVCVWTDSVKFYRKHVTFHKWTVKLSICIKSTRNELNAYK